MLGLLTALNPYRYLIMAGSILVLITGIYFKGYSDGKQHVQVLWDADKTAIAEAAAIQAAKTAKKIAAAQHTTEDITNDYERKISEIRAYYSGVVADGMRKPDAPAADSCSVPALPDSTQGADERAADKRSTPLQAKCAETTQQLMSLQSWILQQKENNP
jgi:hypothetical protein